ncbi:hypothetical protein U1Q18_023079, partial [Sarracenia purpurea var. burkii]
RSRPADGMGYKVYFFSDKGTHLEETLEKRRWKRRCVYRDLSRWKAVAGGAGPAATAGSLPLPPRRRSSLPGHVA